MADGKDSTDDPSRWQKHKQGLRNAFIRHMENEIVDAFSLRWVLD